VNSPPGPLGSGGQFDCDNRELPIWQECFRRYETGEIYATIGKTVPTEFGACNIYLAVENVLLQNYKPRLSNSHFR
jgi:hypothetical protein